MPYVRVTRDEYEVQGNYAGIWECVTTETTYRDARTNLKLYRENEASTCFRIKKMRVKI